MISWLKTFVSKRHNSPLELVKDYCISWTLAKKQSLMTYELHKPEHEQTKSTNSIVNLHHCIPSCCWLLALIKSMGPGRKTFTSINKSSFLFKLNAQFLEARYSFEGALTNFCVTNALLYHSLVYPEIQVLDVTRENRGGDI